jgi:glycosyltransferase involved in cell wall biosynthesis
MRILMVSDVYFPRINGVSTSIRTSLRALERRGHVCTLVAPDYPQGVEPEAGVIRIPSRSIPVDPEDRLMSLHQVQRLALGLSPQRFDLIHVHTPFVAHYAGVRLSRRLGLPRVETYHTLFEEYVGFYAPLLPAGLLRALARALSRRQCNRMDGVIVPSSAMAERLRGYGVTRPLGVIPTGVPLHELAGGDGARFRRRHGIAPRRPVVAYVGRVAHEKNLGFLLRMLAELRRQEPGVLLVIAGEGPARAATESQVVSLGLTEAVRFAGYLSRDGDLLDCYRAADAFVFSSRTETQGLVLLEAMAIGVPVVSTAVMGTRDILLAGRGALIAEEDEAHFAGQVLRLLRDPDLRRRLSSEAREYARSWSDEACAQRLVDFYERVIAAPAAGLVPASGVTAHPPSSRSSRW